MDLITDLKTKHFQHKRNTVGELVTDLDDIAQCYENIFASIKGEVVLYPNFGTNIVEAIGQNQETAEKIIKACIKKDFELQEPRAEVVDVVVFHRNEKTVINVSFKSKIDVKSEIKTKEFEL